MIANARRPTCASCSRFPLEAIGGLGECRMYVKQQAFDEAACVLYEQAKDRAHRRTLVEQLRGEP